MAIAGTLAVNILARTDKFNKGIKSARTSLGAFGKSVKGVGKLVGGFGGTLVGVAGIAGFGAFFKSTVDSIDRLAKLSEQIGTSTEDLGLLSFQADLSGVSQDNLAKSMLKFSRTLSDATNGLTTAIRPLDRLGLSAETLINLDPGAAFGKVAAAMKEMENPLMRSATAMEIFGRSGAELIPLFNSDLAGAAKAFEKMGGAISQEDADKMVAFKDAMTEFKAAVGVAGRDFVISITDDALQSVRAMTILAENVGLIGKEKTAFTKTVAADTGAKGRGGAAGASAVFREGFTELFTGRKRRKAIVEGLGEFFGSFASDPRNRGRSAALENFDKETKTGNRERRRQTQILIESLELQRRAVLSGGTTVTFEAATFE